MSLEFGKNWLQPISDRLSKKYPQLSTEELEKFSTICERLRTEGNQFIYDRLRTLTEEQQKTTEKELKSELTNWLAENHPLVNNANIKRTTSQGIYYAAKDGWADCLK